MKMRWWRQWLAEKEEAEREGKIAVEARLETEKKVIEAKAKEKVVKATIKRSERVRDIYFTNEVRRAFGGGGQ